MQKINVLCKERIGVSFAWVSTSKNKKNKVKSKGNLSYLTISMLRDKTKQEEFLKLRYNEKLSLHKNQDKNGKVKN